MRSPARSSIRSPARRLSRRSPPRPRRSATRRRVLAWVSLLNARIASCEPSSERSSRIWPIVMTSGSSAAVIRSPVAQAAIKASAISWSVMPCRSGWRSAARPPTAPAPPPAARRRRRPARRRRAGSAPGIAARPRGSDSRRRSATAIRRRPSERCSARLSRPSPAVGGRVGGLGGHAHRGTGPGSIMWMPPSLSTVSTRAALVSSGADAVVVNAGDQHAAATARASRSPAPRWTAVRDLASVTFSSALASASVKVRSGPGSPAAPSWRRRCAPRRCRGRPAGWRSAHSRTRSWRRSGSRPRDRPGSP